MQSIDEEDNLVNADRMDVPGKNLLFGDGENDDVSTADLRKELFDGENIVLDKNTDHGVGEILERQKEQEKLAAMADGMESVSEPAKKDDLTDID